MTPDYTGLYNTQLSPQEEKAFQTWVKTLPSQQRNWRDYDLRGAWKANSEQASNGHFPDTFKKPNHPTFSDESIYSSPRFGTSGGKWIQIPGSMQTSQDGAVVPTERWEFQPGPTNVQNWNRGDLLDYMIRNEPDVQLGIGAYQK